MNQINELKLHHLILYYWAPFLVWIFSIFVFSFFPGFIPIRGLQDMISLLPTLRSILHMGEFLILTVLALRCFRNKREEFSPGWVILWAVGVSLSIDFVSEVYQIYIPLRDFEWIDILMNGIGIGVASFIFYLDYLWKRQLRKG